MTTVGQHVGAPCVETLPDDGTRSSFNVPPHIEFYACKAGAIFKDSSSHHFSPVVTRVPSPKLFIATERTIAAPPPHPPLRLPRPATPPPPPRLRPRPRRATVNLPQIPATVPARRDHRRGAPKANARAKGKSGNAQGRAARGSSSPRINTQHLTSVEPELNLSSEAGRIHMPLVGRRATANTRWVACAERMDLLTVMYIVADYKRYFSCTSRYRVSLMIYGFSEIFDSLSAMTTVFQHSLGRTSVPYHALATMASLTSDSSIQQASFIHTDSSLQLRLHVLRPRVPFPKPLISPLAPEGSSHNPGHIRQPARAPTQLLPSRVYCQPTFAGPPPVGGFEPPWVAGGFGLALQVEEFEAPWVLGGLQLGGCELDIAAQVTGRCPKQS
ncbi:hypothetical protein JB92DRAFT_2824970 [Gautieria morchelliformis]|nr:hypothetical protein JB92DRAFT_2824970 [Gautieria morchelliformis]